MKAKRISLALLSLLLMLSLLFTSCNGGGDDWDDVPVSPNAGTSQSGSGSGNGSGSGSSKPESNTGTGSGSGSGSGSEDGGNTGSGTGTGTGTGTSDSTVTGPVTATEGYLPQALFSRLRNMFEGGLASFSAYNPAYAPYTMTNVYLIGNCRLLSVSIPVSKTLGTDKNGNFTFTLSVFGNSVAGLSSTAKRTFELKVNANEYGLKANQTDVNRFIEVPLSSYNIVLAKDEALGFFASTDTLFPAFLPTDASNTNPALNLYKQELPEVTGFFSYLGTSSLANNMGSLCYDLKWERTYTAEELLAIKAEEEKNAAILSALREKYSGKYLSVLGDSISTFKGVSNNTGYNSTIGNNAVWYPNNNNNMFDFTYTYWGRLLTDLNMRLCVNNAWSGSRVYYTNTTTVNMLKRATELDNDNGTPNDPSDDISPDVILVYIGINDLHNGTPFGDLYDLLLAGNGTTDSIVASWLNGKTASDWCTTYALSLKAMTEKYPSAEILCMTLVRSLRAEATDEKITQYNTCIKALASYFGATVIDQQADGELRYENCHAYGSDSNVCALHPSAAGHALMKKLIANTLYRKSFGEYVVPNN